MSKQVFADQDIHFIFTTNPLEEYMITRKGVKMSDEAAERVKFLHGGHIIVEDKSKPDIKVEPEEIKT